MAKSKIQLTELLSVQHDLIQFEKLLREHLKQSQKKYDLLLVLHSLPLNESIHNLILLEILERAPMDIFEGILSLTNSQQRQSFLTTYHTDIRAMLEKIHNYPSLRDFKDEYARDIPHHQKLNLSLDVMDILYFLNSKNTNELMEHFSIYTLEDMDALFVYMDMEQSNRSLIEKIGEIYRKKFQDPWFQNLPQTKNKYYTAASIYYPIRYTFSPIGALQHETICNKYSVLWYSYLQSFGFNTNSFEELTQQRVAFKQMVHMLRNSYVKTHLSGHNIKIDDSDLEKSYISLLTVIVNGVDSWADEEEMYTAFKQIYNPRLFTPHNKLLKSIESPLVRFLAILGCLNEDQVSTWLTLVELQSGIALSKVKDISELEGNIGNVFQSLHDYYRMYHAGTAHVVLDELELMM